MRKIKPSHIRDYAQSMLDFLNARNIHSLSELEAFKGKRFQLPGKMPDFIEVNYSSSPQNRESPYRFTYVSPAFHGNPLEIRACPQLQTSHIILKCVVSLPTYEPIFPPNHPLARYGYDRYNFDAFGNKVQDKVISSVDWPVICEELSNLASLKLEL